MTEMICREKFCFSFQPRIDRERHRPPFIVNHDGRAPRPARAGRSGRREEGERVNDEVGGGRGDDDLGRPRNEAEPFRPVM